MTCSSCRNYKTNFTIISRNKKVKLKCLKISQNNKNTIFVYCIMMYINIQYIYFNIDVYECNKK